MIDNARSAQLEKSIAEHAGRRYMLLMLDKSAHTHSQERKREKGKKRGGGGGNNYYDKQAEQAWSSSADVTSMM